MSISDHETRGRHSNQHQVVHHRPFMKANISRRGSNSSNNNNQAETDLTQKRRISMTNSDLFFHLSLIIASSSNSRRPQASGLHAQRAVTQIGRQEFSLYVINLQPKTFIPKGRAMASPNETINPGLFTTRKRNNNEIFLFTQISVLSKTTNSNINRVSLICLTTAGSNSTITKTLN